MTTNINTAAAAIRTYADSQRIVITDDQCHGMGSAVIAAQTGSRSGDPVTDGAHAASTYATANKIALTGEQATGVSQAVLDAKSADEGR